MAWWCWHFWNKWTIATEKYTAFNKFGKEVIGVDTFQVRNCQKCGKYQRRELY